MANSPDTAEQCYKAHTGQSSPGYGWKWDKSYESQAKNQPAAPDMPDPVTGQTTFNYFVKKA